MPAPSKFAHIVYRTHQFDKMIEWYTKVFDAKVQNQGDRLAFLTYDEEHHRFAFLNLGDDESALPELSMASKKTGVHHVAYTWDTLDGLLDQYVWMKELECMPTFCVRHGPTLSMYYADPDNNGLEFQVDLLNVEDANNFLESDSFNANPIGEPFEPEDLLAARDAGKSLKDFLLRSDQTLPEAGFAVEVD
ncbi:MAG: VOC family protein [Pseudomonadota bacterium]